MLSLRHAIAGTNACQINLSSRECDTYSLASLWNSQILPHLSNMLVDGKRLNEEIYNWYSSSSTVCVMKLITVRWQIL
jgi:hypothetical protein